MAKPMECCGFDAAFPVLHSQKMQNWESCVKAAALHRLRRLRTVLLTPKLPKQRRSKLIIRRPCADIFVRKIFFIFELSQKPSQYLFVIMLGENAEYVHQDRNINNDRTFGS